MAEWRKARLLWKALRGRPVGSYDRHVMMWLAMSPLEANCNHPWTMSIKVGICDELIDARRNAGVQSWRYSDE
jgi:hypothetical protein